MRAPQSAKTTLYFLNFEGVWIGFSVEGQSIDFYGNQNGDINRYNENGELSQEVLPASYLDAITSAIGGYLRIEFESSQITYREGDIENLDDYVIIEE